uniref:Fibulin 2 n=1 Tax=Cyprinus carpio carpio TaxID=630221 RepID=A0A8C1AK07_CYPCA
MVHQVKMPRGLLNLVFLLSITGCLCQRDCTGVNCPELHNCIEEVLDTGACCATCMQTGCMCEGYQYYDCVSAGFRTGKVPEGESYFVDFGSTECSCPQGGGRISCHFIPCPELPANCIELLEPSDGCIQCERIGCVHEGQKYDAGHSFQIDPCQVCHCPNEGGNLMCYPIPNCDPNRTSKPMLTTTAEDSTPERRYQDPMRHIVNHQGSRGRFNKHFPSHSDSNLPFKLHMRNIDEKEEDDEDYDYPPTDSLAPSLHDFANQVLNHVETFFLLCSSVVQKQCCSGALRESRCQAGINAARAGRACEENSPLCGEDSQTDCCNCCALGLRLRREGKGCEAHQHLSYPCGHVFLTCCEEGEEGLAPPTIKKKQRPQPTALPKKVSDSQFRKQALSAGDVDPAANSLEDLEHDNWCQRSAPLCHHTCINTRESYLCACYPGYTLLQDARTCVPGKISPSLKICFCIQHNTCKSRNGPCSQQCSVVRGLAQCSCFPGFSLMADGHTCEGKCTSSRHKCSRDMVCVNREGSYQCVQLYEMCDEGFILNQNRDCVDVNECVINTHTCQANERCVNTVGGFVCERQISCSSGYQLRNGVCEDIDECVTRTHNCGMGFQCQNTDGSFTCNPKQGCLTGFTQDSHGNCIDIDECSSVKEPCTSGFNCINTVGSYTCQRKIIMCSRGYHSSPDGARCIDVDECQTSTHRCGEGQICHNLPGSYRCDCQTGYQYDAVRQICMDVNECWRYPGRLCAQTCDNTPGSYQCSCTTGFSLAFDGKNCEDINECDSNPCSQECANMYGSYQCYCRMGYYLKEDGHTCEDIDECSQSIGNLCAFQCVNVPGSYTCACPPLGYSMSPNGRTCQDIDECAIGSHNCSASQTCFNIQGGFRCLSFACPDNYRRVSDIRCERISCPNFQQCQTMPLRITYYQLSFQTNIIIPAQIFRIGPSPAYSGDNIIISILRGNEDGYFSTRKLNSFTGAVYLQRQVREPRDFLIDVEMKLLRQGTFTTFLARIYVFITANSM